MITTDLFPYSSFPIRLDHSDSQKGMVTCFFACSEHLEKYLNRHNIDRKKCVILNVKDQQNQVQSKPRKSNKVKK